MHEVRVINHTTQQDTRYPIQVMSLNLIVPAMLEQLQRNNDHKQSLVVTINPQRTH